MTPDMAVESRADGGRNISLHGRWTLAAIGRQAPALARGIAEQAGSSDAAWDALEIEALDSAGAMLLWRAWGRRLPDVLVLSPEHQRIFERLAEVDERGRPQGERRPPLAWLLAIGRAGLALRAHLLDFMVLVGQLALDIAHLARSPRELPRREISANVYKGGVRAMPVTALVGFLIGIVLSYLSSLQLRLVGADIFIVNILGMGIVRELGPVLVAVLVAGRSGSAMTAQLGVMRVTEEIDALAAMGVSRSLRLVFPKVSALSIAMPLLVLWTTAMALIGGMVAANIQLDIGFGYFIQALQNAVPVANLWIGLTKGVVFGLCIALVACHFGLRVEPNTDSLSLNTTASVVTAITCVILLDAVFAIMTRNIGLPI
jgi:phospholipid/cholesterol/gamma-HCH transport system permease protein